MSAAGCAALIACPGSPAARTGTPLGYAVSAVGFKSYFVLNARPGGEVSGRLGVVNLSSAARTILLSPVDVSTAAAGGLQYGDVAPHLDGRWLQLSSRAVQLSGSQATEIPFVVHVPARALPGQHFVGIAAVDRRALSRPAKQSGPIRLHFIPRLAMTVQLQLPGPSMRQLIVGGARIDVAPSGASVTIAISNPGDTLIDSTSGDVTVEQGGQPLFSQSIELGPFVPRTAIAYHVPWNGTPAEGTYQVKGDLHPAGARSIVFDRTVTFGHRAIEQFQRQTGRPAHPSSGIPVTLIVALVVALAVALAFAAAYANLRRQTTPRPPDKARSEDQE